LDGLLKVAQVSNLLYRRASSLRALDVFSRAECGRSPCRLEIGDTAGWKPALLRKEERPLQELD